MNDSGSSVPPGWYPDGQSGQRWWDGTQWGPQWQPPSGPPEPVAPPPTMAMPTRPPPQYAPPQYAAQPGSPPPSQVSTGPATGTGASGASIKLLLGIVGGLVGLVVLVIVLVLLLVVGGDRPPSDDPAETVAKFFDAAADGDCDAAFALLTDNARTTFGADAGVEECESANPSQAFGDEVSIDVGTARIDGDDATVPVTAVDASGELDALGLGELTVDFVLEKQDGVWLIDDFGLGSLLENLADLPGLPGATEFSDGSDDPFSDLPSDLLSDFPTDFNPEDFMSDLPSDLFSDLPTE